MYTLRANTKWGNLVLENCSRENALELIMQLHLDDWTIETMYAWTSTNADPDDDYDYEPYLECAV